MKKYITINNERFEVKKDLDFESCVTSHRTLFECYARPSKHKINIYEYWREFFEKSGDIEQFGVCSYNTNIFTLECVAYIPSLEDIYYFYITPKRKEIHHLS